MDQLLAKKPRIGSSPSTKSSQIFSIYEEQQLKEYLKKSSSTLADLKLNQVRDLTYKFALKIGSKYPSKWDRDGLADILWVKSFFVRHNFFQNEKSDEFSPLRPKGYPHDEDETTNIEVMDKSKFSPDRIIHLDASVIKTTALDNRWALQGSIKPQIDVDDERLERVTFLGIIRANGTAIPPMYIFPSCKYQDDILAGAPNGSLRLPSPNGCVTDECFVEVLQHIQKHTTCNASKPILLMLKKVTHDVSISASRFAQENGINLLTFPTDCNMTLDDHVFNLFRYHLKDAFMEVVAKGAIQIGDIGRLSFNAFYKAFTPRIIMAAFKAMNMPATKQDHKSNSNIHVTSYPPLLVRKVERELEKDFIWRKDNKVSNSASQSIPLEIIVKNEPTLISEDVGESSISSDIDNEDIFTIWVKPELPNDCNINQETTSIPQTIIKDEVAVSEDSFNSSPSVDSISKRLLEVRRYLEFNLAPQQIMNHLTEIEAFSMEIATLSKSQRKMTDYFK